MSSEQIFAFLVFAVVAAITPGPSNVMLTAAGANTGVVRGLATLGGVTVGMGLMMFVVFFGFGSLVLENSTILHLLKWCGSGFLLWLAWKIALAGRSETKVGNGQVGFWRAAAFQWVNPKSWLVCAGAAGTYLQAQSGNAFVQSLSLGLLFIVAAVPSCFVWLAFGASIQRLMRTERALRVFNITMGVLLACSVLFFLWE